jgi:hypothetical protein
VRRLRFSRWIFPSRLFFCLRFPLPAFWSRSQRRSIFPLPMSFLVPAPEIFFRLVLLALAAGVQTAPPDFRLGVNPIPELLFTPAWSSRGFTFFVFRSAVLHGCTPVSRSDPAVSTRQVLALRRRCDQRFSHLAPVVLQLRFYVGCRSKSDSFNHV